MKAHEETWHHDAQEGVVWTEGTGAVVALVAQSATRFDRLALTTAAPDMARALLAHGYIDTRGVWHSLKCTAMGRETLCSDECKMDRAALKKAGVI